MAKFKLTWNSGEVEVVNQADCLTISQFQLCRFGNAVPAAKIEFEDVVDAEVITKPRAKALKVTTKESEEDV